MKSLIEHFNEMNTQKLNIAEKTIIYKKLNKIKVDELNKILKGGELVNKNNLLKCKDDIEEFTIMDANYKICVRKIKNTKEYIIINFYSKSTNCVILQMDIKNKKVHLTELLKQQGCLMKKKENNYEDNAKEGGEILMEIIIKICEKLKIEEITLTDDSYILCKTNSNSRINLIYSKMMLDGDTWYGKFGFEPVEEIDKKTYKENQENYNKNIMTKDIKIKYFTREILDKEKDKNKIQEISKKYEEYKNEKLCVFLKWISENYCSIYSEIYEDIYKKAGYKKYTTLEFVLRLKTDLKEFVDMVKSGKYI
jgi:hypothetical protein